MTWTWGILCPSSAFSLIHFFFAYLTIFFSCCKVHDFCEEALLNDADKCKVNGGTLFVTKDFKYNKATNKCCEYVKLLTFSGSNYNDNDDDDNNK